MVRRGLLRATALAAALLCVACGMGKDGDGDDGGVAASASGQSSSVAASTAGSSGPAYRTFPAGTAVSVVAKWNTKENETKSLTAVTDRFTELTGVKVNYEGLGDDLGTILTTRVSDGAPPDVAILASPGTMDSLTKVNALKPLGPEIEELVDANFAPTWKQLGSIDGRLYGVWFKAANKSTIWYRTAAFAAAGLTPPTTWDELLAVSDTFAAAGTPPWAIGGASLWPLTDWFENVYLRTAGPEKYDQLSRHEIPWTDPSVKEAFTELAKIFGRSDYFPGGQQSALKTTFEESVPLVFGAAPKAAMTYEGDFTASFISRTPSKLGTDADFFDFPSIRDSAPMVVGAGDVAVKMTDNPAADELLKFLTSREAAEIWIPLGGFTSPNKTVSLDAYANPISRKSAAALVRADTFRFDLSDLLPQKLGNSMTGGFFKMTAEFLADTSKLDSLLVELEQAAAENQPAPKSS